MSEEEKIAIHIENNEAEIVKSNYWDSPLAASGSFYLSIDARAFRLLIPPQYEDQVPDMLTGRYAAITRGPYQDQDTLEILLDDGSDNPCALHLDVRHCDCQPLPSDVGREDMTLTLWTAGPRKRGSFRAVYRTAERLPFLASHTFRQPPADDRSRTPDTVRRLQSYLAEYVRLYPGAWAAFEIFRRDRGRKGLPDWPAWCWCPLEGAYIVASAGRRQEIPVERIQHVSILGALAAWRMTQGIYRCDSDLFGALWSTPIEEELPIEILFHLPEWCCYIEAPADLIWNGEPLLGWFVFLESNGPAGRAELRLVLDQTYLNPRAVFLDRPSLFLSSQAVYQEAERQANIHGNPFSPVSSSDIARFSSQLAPLISVTLYLCSQAAELRDARGRRGKPENPAPRKVKGGFREFAASGPTTWEVGYRLGASLRAGLAADRLKEEAAAEPLGWHARPRPHIRRAHWHSFWTGPRQDGRPGQKLVLRWLHPLLVAAAENQEGGGIVPTLHDVV